MFVDFQPLRVVILAFAVSSLSCHCVWETDQKLRRVALCPVSARLLIGVLLFASLLTLPGMGWVWCDVAVVLSVVSPSSR